MDTEQLNVKAIVTIWDSRKLTKFISVSILHSIPFHCTGNVFKTMTIEFHFSSRYFCVFFHWIPNSFDFEKCMSDVRSVQFIPCTNPTIDIGVCAVCWNVLDCISCAAFNCSAYSYFSCCLASLIRSSALLRSAFCFNFGAHQLLALEVKVFSLSFIFCTSPSSQEKYNCARKTKQNNNASLCLPKFYFLLLIACGLFSALEKCKLQMILITVSMLMASLQSYCVCVYARQENA